MASLGHIAVGMAAARAYDPERPPRWTSMALWSALSLLPDIDVFVRHLRARGPWFNAAHGDFAAVVLASHGLLDTMTDGGLGAALLWPFSLARYFAPWRPIPVAPIGLDFFTLDGAIVALSELLLFLPLWLFACRMRQRAVAVAVWLVAVWLIGSFDPLRERIVGVVLREDTVFAKGYSEAAFRTVAVGDEEDVVRRSLGEPFGESWFFAPKDFPYQSMMEVSADQLPRSCLGVRLTGGVVEEAMDREICGSRGIGVGVSRADVSRVLGAPSESCAEYSVSPGHGHFRMRMVCFLHGKVELVFRRWV